MRLKIKADPAAAPVATATFNFDFTVTDYDAISIYFPTFDTVAPLVNLDLRYDPIQKVVGGRKQLDMCLYDGLGSQSEYLDVTVRDSGPRPPAGSDFSLWHRDGGSDASQRLDYRVHLDYGGHRLAMKHNVKQQLRGIDSAQLRLVMLPGISQPVYCVPTPLTLETPPTPIASQRPGLYEGELTVVAESTAWATQLRMMAPTILAKLHGGLGGGVGGDVVTRLRVVGPTAPSWKKGPRSVRGRGPRDTYG